MKSAIIVFPGTNRERDMALALSGATGRAPHVAWYTDTALPQLDLIVIPGGFAWGDYLRAGAMAARAPVMRSVADQAKRGVAILGVCNGFQVLTECGLLPGALMRNAGLRFICRNLFLRIETDDTRFTAAYRAGQCVSLPVAHNDGNYYADDQTLDRLEDEDRVVLRYANASGAIDQDSNPNGSARAIAGIVNDERNVFGLMPHPENAVDPLLGSTDGRPLFDSLFASLS